MEQARSQGATEEPVEPEAGPPPRSGGGKGWFGCLGCAGVAVILLVGIPIAMVVAGWFFLPRLVEPADTEWAMVDASPAEAREIQESFETEISSMEPGDRTTLEVSEDELNQMLALALERAEEGPGGPDAESHPEVPEFRGPEGRFLVGRDAERSLRLDLRIIVPEDVPGVLGRLAGRPAGLELHLHPRAVGDAIAVRVDEARLGRVPLPVELALRILSGTDLGREAGFIHPGTGELRLPLRQVGEGMIAEDLTVEDGFLLLHLTRR